jgi:hypothetical protein
VIWWPPLLRASTNASRRRSWLLGMGLIGPAFQEGKLLIIIDFLNWCQGEGSKPQCNLLAAVGWPSIRD